MKNALSNLLLLIIVLYFAVSLTGALSNAWNSYQGAQVRYTNKHGEVCLINYDLFSSNVFCFKGEDK